MGTSPDADRSPGLPLCVVCRFLRRQRQGHIPAVVFGCTVFFVVGMSLTLAADQATTRPNLQTVGLVVMLLALTTLVLTYTMRGPADPT